MKKPAKELIVTLQAVRITGTAYVILWGSTGTSSIVMDETTLPIEEASKENIIKKINDGGFGCKEIVSADVYVDYIYEDYKNNHLIREGYYFETTEKEIKLIA